MNRQATFVWSFNKAPANNATITVDGVSYTLVTSLNNAIPNQVLIGAANGLGPLAGWTAANIVHAANDDGIGKGTLYSSATVAHPTCYAAWEGNPIYNYVFWWSRTAGTSGIGKPGLASPTANGSFDTSTMRMSWNVVIEGGTGAWAKLGSNRLPGTYQAWYVDATHYALYSLGTNKPVDTRSYGPYAGQSIVSLRGDTGGGNPYPVAYTGESWSVTSSLTSDPYFQVNVPGCPNTAHEMECALAYRIPEAPKYPGNFQTISSFVVNSGVATISLTSAFPYSAGTAWAVKPGTLIQLRNIKDTPGSWTHTSSYMNDSSGTNANHLVKFIPGTNYVGALQFNDPGGAIGICQSGCGPSGAAVIADAGLMACTFDTATTAGHWVTVSTNDDLCHDSGASFPGAPQPIGVVLESGPAGNHNMWWNGLNRPFTVQYVNGPGDGRNVTVMTIRVPGYPNGTYPTGTLAGYGGPSQLAFADSHLTVSPYVTWQNLSGGGQYIYPNSTAHVQMKDQSTFDPTTTNRFDFWVKWGINKKACATAGDIEIGTYTTKPNYAGAIDHFYHTGNEATYSGQWTHYTWTNTPTHSQGIPEQLNYNYPTDVTFVGNPGQGHEQAHYFDSLATFYYDLHGLSCQGNVTGQKILLAPTTYSSVAGEPEELVLTRTGVWSPVRFRSSDGDNSPTGTQGYDINWTGPKGYAVQYEVRYSTTGSLKTAGFSTGLCQNGTTNCGPADRVSTAIANPYVSYQSAGMAQAPNIWWAVKPVAVPVLSTSGNGQSPTWIVTPVDMRLNAGDHVTVSGVGGNRAVNQSTMAVSAALGWQNWRAYDPGPMPRPANWVSNPGGPVIVSILNHGYTSGNIVAISGVNRPGANGQFTIAVLDANSFVLNGTSYNAICAQACTGGYVRLNTPGPLTNIISDGAGHCTVNLNVNHNIVPGWQIYVYGTADSVLSPGVSASTNSAGIKQYTVTSTPTPQSFGFSCPGVAGGTYNQDPSATSVYLGVQAFPGVALPVTGTGTYTGGGTIFSTEDTHNFAEIYLPAIPGTSSSAASPSSPAPPSSPGTPSSPSSPAPPVVVSQQTLLNSEVTMLYQRVLGHPPDQAGLTYWTCIDPARVSPCANVGIAGLGQMVDTFLTSQEGLNTNFQAVAIYQAVLGRIPTFAEWSHAVAGFRSNDTPEGWGAAATALINTLLASPEYTARFGLAGNFHDMVTNLYQNALGRPPSVAELNAGVPMVSAGGVSSLFDAIFTGAEYQNSGGYASANTSADHSNKLFIALLYFGVLARDPDANGFSSWVGQAGRGGAGIYFQPAGSVGSVVRLMIEGPGSPSAGFVGSPEFQGLFGN